MYVLLKSLNLKSKVYDIPNLQKRMTILHLLKHSFFPQAFYLRQDVSKVLPHKRFATLKNGAASVMLMTVKQAFLLYKVRCHDLKVLLPMYLL